MSVGQDSPDTEQDALWAIRDALKELAPGFIHKPGSLPEGVAGLAAAFWDLLRLNGGFAYSDAWYKPGLQMMGVADKIATFCKTFGCQVPYEINIWLEKDK